MPVYTPEEQKVVSKITKLCNERDAGYALSSMDRLTPRQTKRLDDLERKIEELWPSVPQKLIDEWEAAK